MELNQNERKLAAYRERARELVKHMTLEEKVAQTQNQSSAIERLGIKAYNWWNEALFPSNSHQMSPPCQLPAGTLLLYLLWQPHAVGNAVSTEARAKFNM